MAPPKAPPPLPELASAPVAWLPVNVLCSTVKDEPASLAIAPPAASRVPTDSLPVKVLCVTSRVPPETLATAPPAATLRAGSMAPKRPFGFGIQPRGEVEGAGQPAVAAVAEGQIPQAVVAREERVAAAVGEGAEVGPAHRVEGVDLGVEVAEVADQQIAAELAEAGRGQRDPPGRGELAA